MLSRSPETGNILVKNYSFDVLTENGSFIMSKVDI